MKIRDRYTGEYAPGNWVRTDDADWDPDKSPPCPVCGAEGGNQCSFPDPNTPGFGTEVGSYIHQEREG